MYVVRVQLSNSLTHLIRHNVPGATFAVLLRGVLVQIVGRRHEGRRHRAAVAARAAVRVQQTGGGAHRGRTRRGQR